MKTSKILRLSDDLPVIVEVVEREERIREALPELDRMIGGGLITLEKVHVILYRPEHPTDPARWDERVQGLQPENGPE